MQKNRDKELLKSRAKAVLDELSRVPAQTPMVCDRGFKARLTSSDILVLSTHYSAISERDPERNPDWKRTERKKYTSQAAWDREQEIVDEAGGGELVFADTLVTYWNKIVITDPTWRPDPEWNVEGGFDHGKTNPTSLLRSYVDFDGNIVYAGEYYQPGKEIWQHAPVIKRMTDFSRMETVYADRTIFQFTSQQEQRPGHSAERAKSYAELYEHQGVSNLTEFSGDVSDVSFAARLHLHWSHLDNREPSVRIFCPQGLYTESPQPGLHNWGCPNLLWELMRTRRVKLTAQQLLSRNTSEAIVDKDNHARDAMKYHLMSHPEPSRKSLERRVTERVRTIMEEAQRQGVTADQAATQAVLQYTKIMHEEVQEENPSTYYGGNARRRIAMLERQRKRGRR